MSKHTPYSPPPWKVYKTEHPYTLGGRDRVHVERKIGTVEEHPQLHGPYPVVTLATGIGSPGRHGIQFVSIKEEDAEFIVRAVNSHADLLSALKQFEEPCDHGTLVTQEQSAMWCRFCMARAAIAKAKA